jgi:hypothetical protein
VDQAPLGCVHDIAWSQSHIAASCNQQARRWIKPCVKTVRACMSSGHTEPEIENNNTRQVQPAKCLTCVCHNFSNTRAQPHLYEL